MNDAKLGDTITFFLNGRTMGTGVVTYVFTQKTSSGLTYAIQYLVRLSERCQEHPAGSEVLVGWDETI